MAAQQRRKAVDVFIHHEGQIRAAADGEVFLVCAARLLDVHIHLAHGTHHARGFVHQPASVGIGHQFIRRLQHRARFADALDVFIGIAAHLELKPPVTFLAIGRDFAGHCLGRFLRNGAVQNKVIPKTAAKQFTNALPACLPEQIPARHV